MITQDAHCESHRAQALARLAGVSPSAYARTRNHLLGEVTRLSPYLTHGVITLRETLRGLPDSSGLPVQHKLIYEFGWRAYYRHVWSHLGHRILGSLQPGLLPDSAYEQSIPPDVRQAATGLRVIDEAVSLLYREGHLHNHARMWLASYLVHVRKVHWRIGADWMMGHLLDGDLASNHLSWQWIAGTLTGKPYLFNADNVTRFAPAVWHSPGTVIDQSYEALDTEARDPRSRYPHGHSTGSCPPGMQEPVLSAAPPPALEISSPVEADRETLKDQPVWLVHPWALRNPPPDSAPHTRLIGVYLRDYHRQWPWHLRRWSWVDAEMKRITPVRWSTDLETLRHVLSSAASVRYDADPHIDAWLAQIASPAAADNLFPSVTSLCGSFSQWWRRSTRGITWAHELLDAR